MTNYWWYIGLADDPTKVITSETLTISGMCVCLVFALVLAILVTKVPGMVAGIITGSSISAMAFSGVGASAGSAAGLAMGMASGGAMLATQAAGVGLALNSAYKQTQENMNASEGLFQLASDAGGLAGVMSRGVAFAGDMMSNLAGGAKESAKGSIQESSIGGKMSANIDADREASQARREDGPEDGGGDESDAVALADSSAPADEVGGGATDSVAVTGSDAGAVNGGGDADTPAGDSGFAPAMTGGDPGDVFGGPWDMSGGYGDDPAHSEWIEAIKNYDPSKIGRLDDE